MYPIPPRAMLSLLAPLVLALAASLTLTDAAAAGRRTLCVHGIEPPNALKVHSGPGEDSAVLGAFPAKACDLKLAGRCQGHWCQMSLGKSFGWVDTRHVGVYELPDGNRAATVRAVPNAPFDPAKEKPVADGGPAAGTVAKAGAEKAPPRIVVEKAPPPRAAPEGPPARIASGKRPVPKAAPSPVARAAPVVRPAPVARPQPVARPSARGCRPSSKE